ncbi:MAG: sorbosone dehydrogenase family protein [Candidatus Nanohaloarchaea archaeon]
MPLFFMYVYPHVGGNPATVTYCDKTTCEEQTIRRTYSSCNEFYPGSDHIPVLKDTCDRTAEGTGDVTLVTDPGNHITASLTETMPETSVVDSEIAGGWDLEFLPGGMLITQKDGTVLRYRDGEATTLAELDVFTHENLGLMGAAVDPDFPRNRYIYLYYANQSHGSTWDRFPKNLESYKHFVESRVSRFRLVNGTLQDETVLLDGLPGSTFHGGGRLEIGPDQKLYLTTGDASVEFTAPWKEYMNGKYMRINLDGSIPSDNPFNNSPIYTTGHRNPQGIAWNPATGTLWGTEHGNWRHDEINRLEKGGNYGWPLLRCDRPSTKIEPSMRSCVDTIRNGGTLEDCSARIRNSTDATNQRLDKPDITLERISSAIKDAETPAACFKNWTLAPSGATFVDDPGHPWHGDLFVAGLRGHHIHRFEVENGTIVDDEIFYISSDELSNRLRDVEYHNGSLYVLGDWKGLARLSPPA